MSQNQRSGKRSILKQLRQVWHSDFTEPPIRTSLIPELASQRASGLAVANGRPQGEEPQRHRTNAATPSHARQSSPSIAMRGDTPMLMQSPQSGQSLTPKRVQQMQAQQRMQQMRAQQLPQNISPGSHFRIQLQQLAFAKAGQWITANGVPQGQSPRTYRIQVASRFFQQLQQQQHLQQQDLQQQQHQQGKDARPGINHLKFSQKLQAVPAKPKGGTNKIKSGIREAMRIPGRCHACNRAETQAWRRGPDGARTLCNACGLHYEKLIGKMGTKASASGSRQPTFQSPNDASAAIQKHIESFPYQTPPQGPTSSREREERPQLPNSQPAPHPMIGQSRSLHSLSTARRPIVNRSTSSNPLARSLSARNLTVSLTPESINYTISRDETGDECIYKRKKLSALTRPSL